MDIRTKQNLHSNLRAKLKTSLKRPSMGLITSQITWQLKLQFDKLHSVQDTKKKKKKIHSMSRTKFYNVSGEDFV